MILITESVTQVCVLMAVYNAERYLALAVESILSQTLQGFQFIIVNDGSTDRSLRILDHYASSNPQIKVVNRERRGLLATRNELLQLAQAEFVAIMDADDIAVPNRLEKQLCFLRDHPEIVCIGGAYEIIDDQGRLLTTLSMPTTHEEIQELALVGHTSINHPCSMMRLKAVQAVGGYDESLNLCEDLDLWLKLGEQGQLANLSDVVLKYRVHTQSTSEKNQALAITEKRIICERAWHRRGITRTFEADHYWRPGSGRASRCKFALKYGWWAFQSCQRYTALIYALRALTLQPVNRQGWILLLCSLFKPMPVQQQRHLL